MIFYEKIGCQGNRKQKEILDSLNIRYETRDILNHPWKKELLEEFFKDKEISECINPFAPKVKSGEIDPKTLTKEQGILKMLKEPILIKRPLIEVNGEKICGFDTQKLSEVLGITVSEKSPFVCSSTTEKCTN